MKFLKAFEFLALVITWGALFSSVTAKATTEGGSADVVGDLVRAPSSLTSVRNGVSRKRYPGGADEDDLQVQATLPIPSRTFDGAATNAAIESGAADSAPPAAND